MGWDNVRVFVAVAAPGGSSRRRSGWRATTRRAAAGDQSLGARACKRRRMSIMRAIIALRGSKGRSRKPKRA